MGRQIRELVHTLLIFTTFLFIITGMGVTEPNLINALTLRLLSKETSYRIHSWLLYPFTLLLVSHIYFTVAPRLKKKED